jgi:ribosomal protein S18 acetylase RimI-like enzyme
MAPAAYARAMLRLQPATPADLPALLPLMQDFYRGEALEFRPGYHDQALAKLLENPQLGHVWWITHQDRRVGYLVLTVSYSLEYGGLNGLIDELYLAPAHRGQGLGRATLEALEQTCQDLGIGVIYLEASHDNVPAQGLYRQQGFQDQRRFLLSKRLAWDGV